LQPIGSIDPAGRPDEAGTTGRKIGRSAIIDRPVPVRSIEPIRPVEPRRTIIPAPIATSATPASVIGDCRGIIPDNAAAARRSRQSLRCWHRGQRNDGRCGRSINDTHQPDHARCPSLPAGLPVTAIPLVRQIRGERFTAEHPPNDDSLTLKRRPERLACACSLLQRLRPLAQHELLDLARRRLRQLLENNRSRQLEAGKMVAREGDDLVLGSYKSRT
jgi:hypothetical protein